MTKRTLGNLPVRSIEDASRQIDQLRRAHNDIVLEPPLSDVNKFTVAVSTARTIVQHGLGRSPLGYLVVRRDTDVIVYDEQDANKRPTDTLFLKADKAATITVLVF